MKKFHFGLLALALAAIAVPALAGNTTLFSSTLGDITFPLSPPTSGGATPGRLDNTAIGVTTAAPGNFTTLTSTSAPSGTGITALFASPPAIGGTVPAAGNFTAFTSTDGVTCPSILPAAAVDAVFFIATRGYTVISISQVHSVAAGGTSVLQVSKDTSTNAPGTGTDLLSAGFNLNATANTVQAGTLVASGATKTLAAGDRLAVDFADAIQSSAGVVVTVCLAPR